MEREENFGLARNIIDGVTQVVNEYGTVIVMEDDLVVSPQFLKFMNQSLDFYKDDSAVMHISAYIYPINEHILPDTFFLGQTTCWGWATWKRAWVNFEKKPNKLIQTFTPQMIEKFNLNGAYNFWKQVELNHAGKMNTWAIFWYATVFLQNGLSLHPKSSYVQNIGHDGSGTNRSTSKDFKVHVLNKMLDLSDKLEMNAIAEKEVENYFNSIKVSFLKRVINKVRRLLP